MFYFYVSLTLDFLPWVVLLSVSHNVYSSPIPPSPTAPTHQPEVIPPSTTPHLSPVTNPSGCFYEGKFFLTGSEIHHGFDSEANWCWWTYCNEDGNVIAADTPNCKTTQPPMTTTNADEIFEVPTYQPDEPTLVPDISHSKPKTRK